MHQIQLWQCESRTGSVRIQSIWAPDAASPLRHPSSAAHAKLPKTEVVIFFISKDWQQHLYSCINKNKKQRMSKHWVYACSSSPLSPQNQSPLSIWKNYIYPSSCIQLWHKGPAGSEDNIVHIWKLRNKNVGTQPHFHCRFCSSTLSPFSSQPYLSSDWLPQTGWFCLCVNLGPNPQVSVKTICDQHYWIRFLQCVWIFCIHRRAETCKVSCSNI